MDKNKSAEIIRIFPLLVYKTKVGLTDEERDILAKEIFEQETKSKKLLDEASSSAWTGDTKGFEFLYTNKKFEKLFNLISASIKKYTELLGINNEKIDFYYQRAWATISRKDGYIGKHKHSQSHISFAYYLKKDKHHGALNFHNESVQNEIAPMLFRSPSDDSRINDFFKPNYDNAKVATVYPQVDEIYIFPSKVVHSTAANKTTNERISISADISLIAKDSENLEHLLTPINRWMKF